MSNAPKPVIVGYDGSEQSQVAVGWAALAATRRRAPLLVLTTREWEEPIPVFRDEKMAERGRKLARDTAEEGCAIARRAVDGIEVSAEGELGSAADVLAERSKQAQLVVVGHQGHGRVRDAMLGSVAYAVANRAQCPVGVIRGVLHDMPSWYYPSVVAIDGSPQSQAALDLAAQWAAESQSLLRMVVAWKAGLLDHDVDAGKSRQTSRAEQAARDILAAATKKVAADHPKLKIDTVVGEGRAADVIVKAATDASLLVMGARGRGGLASLLLGSVSREVMQHAQCPVYIVR